MKKNSRYSLKEYRLNPPRLNYLSYVSTIYDKETGKEYHPSTHIECKNIYLYKGWDNTEGYICEYFKYANTAMYVSALSTYFLGILFIESFLKDESLYSSLPFITSVTTCPLISMWLYKHGSDFLVHQLELEPSQKEKEQYDSLKTIDNMLFGLLGVEKLDMEESE